MADIYLTKIERKTIFTRSLIYVLVLFLIADLTVTGPFYFNFIPWLYLFSCFLSLREVDKTLTGIIGTFTVLIASLVTYGTTVETLLVTANAVIQLVLGMLTSKGIYQFVLEHRLVKYLRPRIKVILITVLMVFFIVAMVTLSFVEGDVFTYIKSKKTLAKYIEKTYDVEYTVKEVIFNRQYIGRYAYVVEIDKETLELLPSLVGTFKDINQEERLETLNTEIKDSSKKELDKILKTVKEDINVELTLVYKYTKVGVKPDALHLEITVVASDTDETYEEISKIINEVLKLKYEVTDVSLMLNKTSIHITKDNLWLITPEYIKGGFNIEDLDE